MHKETSLSGSIVVHCHAGLGRTGVAVALDICLARIRQRATVDVHDTIVSENTHQSNEHLQRRIRAQRAHSILNRWQYVLVYATVADCAKQLKLLPDMIV